MLATSLILTERQEFFSVCQRMLEVRNIHCEQGSYNEKEVRKKLETLQPHMVIMDVNVNDKAISALNILHDCPLAVPPAVFLRLDKRIPSSEKTFICNGVMYVFDSFMGEVTMVDCIISLYSLYRGQVDEKIMDQQVASILKNCGIALKHKGYQCIMDGVRLIYRKPELGQALTKKVYPSIAEKQHTEPTRVEKNIRDAIGNAWENGRAEKMVDLLGFSIDRSPSNGQFILAVCEKVREIMEGHEQPEKELLNV